MLYNSGLSGSWCDTYIFISYIEEDIELSLDGNKSKNFETNLYTWLPNS